MILGTVFKHGGLYHYRIHRDKLEFLCSNGFQPLKSYLMDVRTNCPSKYFEEGPRSSVLRFGTGAQLKETKADVSVLARMGLESNYYDNAHLNVQMFMLGFDNKTIAIEVPLWLLPSELPEFKELFNSELPLSGHIDIVRIEDGKIWIWDYKPNAHLEKFASTQTYFYALMLSKRTGISLENFMCGYFDDKYVYTFSPSVVKFKAPKQKTLG